MTTRNAIVQDPGDTEPRRTFLARASSAGMAVSCAASYGTLATFAGAFLYPAKPRQTAWFFVAEVNGIAVGQSLNYRAPGGERITVTHQGQAGAAEDFLALSSVCPHLGCQVRWESQNSRFFCPCHNGAFDPSGKATEGPPAEAGQSLSTYRMRVENGLLFIEVPM